MYLLITLAVILIAYFGQIYVKSVHIKYINRHIPTPPMDSWFSGHINNLNRAREKNGMLDLIMEWKNTVGKTYSVYINALLFMFTHDPVVLKVLATDITNFKKSNDLPNRAIRGQKLIGYHSILSANGTTWGMKRKHMSHFFSKSHMKDLFPACQAKAEGEITAMWRKRAGPKGTTLDLHDLMAVTYVHYLCAIGMDGLLTPEKVADYTFKILNEISIKQTKQILDYSKVTGMKKQSVIDIVKELRQEAMMLVKKRSKDMRGKDKDDEALKNSLTWQLIEANRINPRTGRKHRDLSKIMDNVVDDLVTVCLVTDNLVKQTCTLFMFLEQHPDIQERMWAELREVEVGSNRDLNKLGYTEKCILEAMRMGPALLRGLRMSKETKIFAGYEIKAPGFRVAFNHYVMHHSEEYWEDPFTFNPDRWRPDFVPAEFSYTPFWAGARSCIGKHLAMMLMKLTLHSLAKNFDVQQQFDKEKPPTINQNIAPMKLINEVTCFLKPVL